MSSDIKTWLSNGKLLLTGEYLVMKGALSLALPLNVGQSLSVNPNNVQALKWQANHKGINWFSAEYNLKSFTIISSDNPGLAQKLKDILVSVRKLSPSFLRNNIGYDVVTNLDFNPEYGFGTSSTLISNIASWANIDPYELLNLTFGGSGYDIACASSNSPLLFQKKDNDNLIKKIDFNPPFTENLYFVYLGNKQSSSNSIATFNKNANFTSSDITNISDITNKVIIAKDILDFEKLMNEHELLLSKVLGLPTAKSLYFTDFKGTVKSLGAWGGDFVLVTSTEPEDKVKSYMKSKGRDIVFKYKELTSKID